MARTDLVDQLIWLFIAMNWTVVPNRINCRIANPLRT